MELKNSTILITGGSSGIGFEFIKQLTSKGVSKILITGRDISRLAKAKEQFPQIDTFQCDAADPFAIQQLSREVISQFPELNIIINNAGIMRNLNLLNTDLKIDEITEEIDISLSGSIRMVQAFLPHLLTKNSAAIINVSSGLAFVPFPASPVYSAAKAGLHAYTRVLRLQLKKTNIRVFELAPPGTDTPLVNAFTGILDSNSNMAVDKMVSLAIKGISNNNFEIKPGLAKILKIMSRLAPEFILNFFHKTMQKGMANKLS